MALTMITSLSVVLLELLFEATHALRAFHHHEYREITMDDDRVASPR